MPPGARFAPFRSFVFSRPAALLAAVLSTLIVIGCMSLNISDNGDPSVLVQTGSIEVQAGQELEIFEVMWRLPHPSAGDVLSLLGTHHPDREIAKAARKAAFKARQP